MTAVWSELVEKASTDWKVGNFQNTLRKLSLSTTMYQILKERNRNFENQIEKEEMMRYAVMGKDRKYDRTFVDWMICKNWGISEFLLAGE